MLVKSALTPCHVSTACQHKESLSSKGFLLLFFDANVSDKTKIAVTLVFGAVAPLTKKPEYSGYEINNVCVLLLFVCFFISL